MQHRKLEKGTKDPKQMQALEDIGYHISPPSSKIKNQTKEGGGGGGGGI